MQRHVGAATVSAVGPLECTPGIDAVPTAYLVQANCDRIASCIYRQGKNKRGCGYCNSINLPKICVALASTTGRTRVTQLAWEVDLHPATATRMLVRQMGILVEARPS